jgi:hypothetical protein
MNAMLGNDGRDEAFGLQQRHGELVRQQMQSPKLAQHLVDDSKRARTTNDANDEDEFETANEPAAPLADKYEIGFPFSAAPALPSTPAFSSPTNNITPTAATKGPASPRGLARTTHDSLLTQVSPSLQLTPPSPFLVADYMADVADFQLDRGGSVSTSA